MSSESGETVEKNFAFHPIPREKRVTSPLKKMVPKMCISPKENTIVSGGCLT
jgi:hypothetical protein